MKDCPENPTPLTCAMAAAEYLIDGNHIQLERDEQRPGRIPIIANKFGNVLLKEILKPKFVTADGDNIVAYAQCSRCTRHIRLTNEFTRLSAEIVEE